MSVSGLVLSFVAKACAMKHFLKLGALAIISACSFPDDTACTMEFRTVGIQTAGLQLQNHYTLRIATGDTLRHDTMGGFSPGYYVVLDDRAAPWLKGTVEDFVFEGWLNDSLLIHEPFRIGADACHIEWVSGNTNWP